MEIINTFVESFGFIFFLAIYVFIYMALLAIGVVIGPFLVQKYNLHWSKAIPIQFFTIIFIISFFMTVIEHYEPFK